MTNRLAVVLALALSAGPPAASAEEAAPSIGSTPAWAGTTSPATPSATAPALPASPFTPGEEIDFAIDYLHVRTATARLVVGRPEGSVWPFIFQAKTDGLATLLDIREHLVSYWDAEARLPRGSDLNAIEVGDRHTDRARFDRLNGKATVQVVRKGKAHESTHEVPRDAQDLASALFALRIQPLRPGARFEYPVFSGTDTFLLQAEVEGEETLETPAGRFETYRVRVRLGFTGKFKTSRDSYAWVTKDFRHVPVRMSADFAIGGATATLIGYRPGGELATR